MTKEIYMYCYEYGKSYLHIWKNKLYIWCQIHFWLQNRSEETYVYRQIINWHVSRRAHFQQLYWSISKHVERDLQTSGETTNIKRETYICQKRPIDKLWLHLRPDVCEICRKRSTLICGKVTCVYQKSPSKICQKKPPCICLTTTVEVYTTEYMEKYVWINICVCIWIKTYKYIHTNIHIYINIHMYIYIHVYICIYVYV